MTYKTKKISINEYLSLVEKNEYRSLYHNEAWLKTVHKGFGIDVYAVATENDNGDLVSLMPIMAMKKLIINFVGSPLRGMYTEFMGPFFLEDVSNEIKKAVVSSQHEYLKKNGGSYVSWGVKSGDKHEYLTELNSKGYEYVPKKTLVIDLRIGEEAVWNNFKGRARNMIRKSEKNGVVTRIIEPQYIDMENYYKMLLETFKKQGLQPPHPLSFFKSICDFLVPGDNVLVIFAEREDRLVAGGIFLCSKDRMMYLSGAANNEGLKFAASSLIQWEAIKKALKLGVKEYDLGGVGVSKIDKFKESFGGDPCEHQLWIYRAPFIKLLEYIYSLLAKKGLLKLHK